MAPLSNTPPTLNTQGKEGKSEVRQAMLLWFYFQGVCPIRNSTRQKLPKVGNVSHYSPKLLSRWDTRQETQPSLFKLDTGLVPFPTYITGRLHTYKQSLSKNIQCDDKFGFVFPTNCSLTIALFRLVAYY